MALIRTLTCNIFNLHLYAHTTLTVSELHEYNRFVISDDASFLMASTSALDAMSISYVPENTARKKKNWALVCLLRGVGMGRGDYTSGSMFSVATAL